MKNILLYSMLLISLSTFSQSEIWGIKEYGGKHMGGFLYTIDSASAEVVVQHRFKQMYKSLFFINQVVPHFHKSSGNWIGISEDWIFKYHPVFGTLESKKYNGLAFGSFYALNDTVWYIIENNGLLKLNPESLKIKSIEIDIVGLTSQDVAISRLDEKHLIWQQVNKKYDAHICKLNLETDEVEILYDFDSFEDGNYFPVGRLIPFQGKHYGLCHQRKDAKRYLLIYSFNVSTSEFKLEYRVENKRLSRTNVNGLEAASNGKFYSIAPISYNNSDDIVFSFDPTTSVLDSLVLIPESIGENPYGGFLKAENGLFYGKCEDGSTNKRGSVFSFNINNNEFELIYAFEADVVKDSRPPIAISDENLLFGTNYLLDTIQHHTFFEINPANSSYRNLTNLNFNISNHMGDGPIDMVQLDNGIIIGTAKTGGLLTNDAFYAQGTGVLYQFDPFTKEYSVLYDFPELDSFEFPTNLFRLSDNRIFIIVRSTNRNYNSSSYIYHIETNTMEFLGDFPWAEFESEVIMISDSVFYTFTNRYLRPPYALTKYNLSTAEVTEIASFSDSTWVSSLNKFDSNHLVYQEIVEHTHTMDSTKINKIDIYTGEVETITNVNQVVRPRNNVWFEFVLLENGMFYGDLFKEFVPLEEGEESLINGISMARYSMEQDKWEILRNSEVSFIYTDFEIFNVHDFIQPFDDMDILYAVNEFDSDNFTGSLKHINMQGDSLEKLDDFEDALLETPMASDYFKSKRLKKFAKTDFNIYWRGTINENWYEAENWLGGIVPDTNALVCIDAFTPFELKIDSLVKCKQMIIIKDAKVTLGETGVLSLNEKIINYGSFEIRGAQTQKGSFISAEETVNKGETKYFFATDTSYNMSLASPVETVGFQESVSYQISEFSSGDLLWNPVSYYPFAPNVTIAYLFETDFKNMEFKGDFNYGDYELKIPRSIDAELYPHPNPYPSSLDWRDLNLLNLSTKAIYKFNAEDSTYQSYVDGLGDASPLIQPLDVFWVHGIGGDQIPLNNSLRMHAINFKADDTPNRNELVLKASGKDGSDKTHISFNENATAGFDKNYDALEFILTARQRPQIFTFGGEERLDINQLPDTAMMDLAVHAGQDGDYTISIDKNIDFGFVVLEDLIWKKQIDLLEQDYSFDYFTSDGDYPFKLYFKPWAIEPVNETDIEIYYYPESIVVRSRKQIDFAYILFYDLAGRVALELQAEEFHHFEKPISLPVGHYIVQVRTVDLVVNRKVLVRR